MTAALLAAALALTAWRATVAWNALAANGSDVSNFFASARELAAGHSPYSVPEFDYPPALAFVLAPISSLAELESRRVWLLVNSVALALALLACYRVAGRGARGAAIVLSVWIVAGTMSANLVLGQLNPVLLALAAGAMAVAWSRPRIAGVAIGVAAALKLWPAALAAALGASAGRRRAIAGFAAALGLTLVLPWIVVARLPGPATPTTGRFWAGTPAPLNDSLSAAVLRLTSHRPASSGPVPEAWSAGNQPRHFELAAPAAALSLIVSGTTMGAGLALLFGRARPLAAIDPRWSLAAILSLALVASPISWYHYQLLQIPGAVVLLSAPAASRRGEFARWALVLASVAALTRAPGWLIGQYVERWGWTADHRALLLFVTTLPALLGAAFAAWIAYEGGGALRYPARV